jgi:hypothetical protein
MENYFLAVQHVLIPAIINCYFLANVSFNAKRRMALLHKVVVAAAIAAKLLFKIIYILLCSFANCSFFHSHFSSVKMLTENSHQSLLF